MDDEEGATGGDGGDDEHEQSNAIVSRLRGISSEEKTELGKMKCRVDDQARLIMMLKKRNDEYLLQNIQLDKHSQQLEQQLDLLKDQLSQHTDQQQRINDLHRTIEQLKASNQILIDQQSHLQQQILFQRSQTEQTDRNEGRLNEQIQLLHAQLKEEEQRFALASADLHEQLQGRRDELQERDEQIHRLNEQIQQMDADLREKLRQIRSNDDELQRHIDQHRSDLVERDNRLRTGEKALQKCAEKEKELQKRIEEKEKVIVEWQQRFRTEEEKVNLNVRVQTLEDKLNLKDEQLNQIQQEFNAYRTYTTSLLSKEKQINERLQNLLSGKSA